MTEAGPSSAPLFKKRGKAGAAAASRLSTSVVEQPASSTSSDLPAATTEDEQLSVQDLIALRSLNRKPTGIDLDRLNKPQRSKDKSKPKAKSAAQLEEERWDQQMKQGGLVAGNSSANTGDQEDSDQEDASKGRRLVRKNNFQGETSTVDVDKHMMAYIEAEMAKRTGSSANATSSMSSEALLKAANNPEDELYAVAEKYKQLQRSIKPEQTQEEREGNVALSAAMLSSIPEVDLGIDTRMKNIQETEKAKREFLNKHRNQSSSDSDQAYANVRFSHTSQHNTRKDTATDQLVLDRFKKR